MRKSIMYQTRLRKKMKFDENDKPTWKEMLAALLARSRHVS